MAAVQLMCARLGMVTGRGLASSVRLRYPHWVRVGACLLLVVANVVNVRRRPGRHGRSHANVTGGHRLFLDAFLRAGDCRAAVLALLPPDRTNIQMAALVLFAY